MSNKNYKEGVWPFGVSPTDMFEQIEQRGRIEGEKEFKKGWGEYSWIDGFGYEHFQRSNEYDGVIVLVCIYSEKEDKTIMATGYKDKNKLQVGCPVPIPEDAEALAIKRIEEYLEEDEQSNQSIR